MGGLAMDPRYLLNASPRDCMRELNARECEAYYLGQACPGCGASTNGFIFGPRGGASVNVECPACLARFNVIDTRARPFAGQWGQVIREPLPAPWRVGGNGKLRARED